MLSPPYAAVIVACVPTASDEVLNVACPDPLTVPVPSVVVPSLKVTVPVGPGLGLTIAVNVTACPNTDGLPDDVTDVLEVFLLNVTVTD